MSKPSVIILGFHQGIYLQRLARNVEKLATKVGVNVDVLMRFVNETQGLCNVCLAPYPEPHIFIGPVDETRFGVRGLVCGTCNAAIAKCKKELARYAKHRRFNPARLSARVRLGRLIALSTVPEPRKG